MTLYTERASTITKLTSVESYYGRVPINIGNSIIPSAFVVDPLNPTNGVVTGLNLSLEIPSWSNVLAKSMLDELPVSIRTLLTEKFAMVSVTTRGSS